MGKTIDDNEMVPMGELARGAGVSAQTVQYYSMMGLIEETARTEGGRRLFSRGVLKRVKLISMLNKSGYPLREIREMFLDRLAT